MKAIWIRTDKGTVEAVDYDGLSDLQHMVGDGTICFAGTFNRDTVYVNDEGLYLFRQFFELPGCGQGLFAGPGVIVGSEIGDTPRTRAPKTTLEEVTSKVKFLGRFEALRRSQELGI